VKVSGPIQNEVDKKDPSKATGQKPLEPRASDLDDQPAAQLDLAADSLRQRFVNIAARQWPYNGVT
jgi:hypothetical protein